MRRAVVGVASVAVIAVGGYAVADAYDRVPGIVTMAALPTPRAAPTPSGLPAPDPSAAVLPAVGDSAPAPTSTGLAARLRPLLADTDLGGASKVGVSVRDGLTGESLYAAGETTPRMAASTTKLLAAAAITHTENIDATLPTRVVTGATPDQLVLVATGDTLLSPGAGHPTAVLGHAGLADLADQVAAALATQGLRKVTLRLDLSAAAGPAYASTWMPSDWATGATLGVHLTGLSTQRPDQGLPAAADPPRDVATAFAARLKAKGITVRLSPRATWAAPAPKGARQLGVVQSAPLRNVLTFALDASDNALTELLTRLAATRAGYPATFPGSARFITDQLRDLGIDTTGLGLKDASGLSRSGRVPVRVLADVLALTSGDQDPALAQVVAALPVAGLTGTLSHRFDEADTRSVAGLIRAKTGTLRGSSGLAGTLVDADGRLLQFVVVADHLPSTVGTEDAREALDRLVAGLAGCGCR